MVICSFEGWIDIQNTVIRRIELRVAVFEEITVDLGRRHASDDDLDVAMKVEELRVAEDIGVAKVY